MNQEVIKEYYIFLQKKFNLKDKEFKLLQKNLIEVSIKTGQVFCEFDEIPKGVLFLISGEMRITTIDNKNELITIEKYKNNEIAGAVEILQGLKEFQITAVKQTKALFLENINFLELISKCNNFKEYFDLVSKQEYYLIAKNNNLCQSLSTINILKWAEIEKLKNKKVLSLSPGIEKLIGKSESYFISSNNVQNKEIGEEVFKGEEIKITGKINARLICKSFILPSENINIDKSVTLIELNKNENKKKIINSLENFYGRKENEKSYPDERGKSQHEQSMACVRMISLYFGIPFRRDLIQRIIKEQIINNKDKNLNIYQFGGILDLIGLHSSLKLPSNMELIRRLPLPALTIQDGQPVILWEKKNDHFIVSKPIEGKKILPIDSFISKGNEKTMQFLFIEKTNLSPTSKFGIKFFIPFLRKYRYSLVQVVLASFFVQLLALFNPLLIQQIIDSVINQGSLRSLNILGILLLSMAFFQALLGSLRTFLFSDTTNRIDISLGKRIIHHLFRLPLSYFSRKQVGEVSSRISELEKIRNFLTGTALTVLLDSLFSVIYILIMFRYSPKLTFYTLSVIPFFIILTVIVSPIIKQQLQNQAEANAKVNSHLVETISGIETIKGQGAEVQSEWRWEKLYGKQINSSFLNTITSTTASSIANFLQQISGLIVIWVGASLVLEGKLSLGQLIAFRILSSYVTNPLLRISSIWQNFQEISISLNRLSDIVDHPDEIEINGELLPPLPPIKGDIKFEAVNFSFGRTKELQIKDVNLKVSSGKFIGIVGSSGSGKSTLLKLLMRFYDISGGIIKVDNYDISKFDLYSLRTQIGIVAQESLLFEGTVQSNIAINKPYASFEEILNASKLACADEFIQNLNNGYSTKISEKGSELSGGQRQRIAIARMIVSNPNLIILDEATSALDVDTEKRVLKNLINIFDKKTILFISHRLNSLINADKILVMHNGLLVEEGRHQELIKKKGRYATLVKQQDKEI